MSTQFVRYTPDIEAADPYFDENLQIVIGKIEKYIAGSVTTEGIGRAVRDAHAKGYGVVKAEVEILGQVPAEYAQGIYAVPGKHGALIRFSNGQPHPGPDMLLGPVAGMALLSFTPWRVTAEHSPLGNIMRARKRVYRHASVLRHTLNHQQRKEPSSADEILP